MKRRVIWICLIVLVLAVFFVLVILPGFRQSNGSTYDRRVEDNLFSLEMKPLNAMLEETYSLHEGDTIDVSADLISGELSISIGQENREPVYEGKNSELGSFQVTIPEDGDYTISVSGEQAEGSISLQIKEL